MNYISNIDTLIFLLNIEEYEKKCKEILNILKIEKEKANLYFQNTKLDNYSISLNGMYFILSRSGTKGYSYILNNDNFNICIAEFVSGIKNYKPIKIRISSQALWNLGLNQSYTFITNWIKNTFGNIIEENVYRIDLACHCNNDFVTNYEKSYKGHFKKSTITTSGNSINALCFGSRKNDLIYCRIYNKSLEIKETKSKTWFQEIWNKNNLNPNNVWNIEFEVKSEFLRNKNLKTFNDIYEHLQDIWKFCTSDWLVKVVPNRTRISRCEISKDWLEIQNTYNTFKSTSFIDNQHIQKENAKILVPTIIGYLSSYSANKHITNFSSTMLLLESDAKLYLKSKNLSFEELVKAKMQKQGGDLNV